MQVAQGFCRDDAAVILHNIVCLRRDTSGNQPELLALPQPRMSPEDGHRLKHSEGGMYFIQPVFLTQIQAGQDKLQPDRIINNPEVDAPWEQRSVQCGKMTGRTEAKERFIECLIMHAEVTRQLFLVEDVIEA
ncbi:hypothetical protein [Pantoea dispersa]|uniref:hypothetical protein n=1 Tax=Pantoea dispersa TaxID=59814 RepID=UPI0039B64D47